VPRIAPAHSLTCNHSSSVKTEFSTAMFQHPFSRNGLYVDCMATKYCRSQVVGCTGFTCQNRYHPGCIAKSFSSVVSYCCHDLPLSFHSEASEAGRNSTLEQIFGESVTWVSTRSKAAMHTHPFGHQVWMKLNPLLSQTLTATALTGAEA
jgi:hypothetical protein